MGLEALSRGASHATFLEKNRLALQAIYKNPPYGQNAPGTSQTLLDAALTLIDSSKLLAPNGILFLEEATTPTAPLIHLTLEKERPVGDCHLYQYTTSSS